MRHAGAVRVADSGTHIVMVRQLKDGFVGALLHEAGLRGTIKEQQQILLATHLVWSLNYSVITAHE